MHSPFFKPARAVRLLAAFSIFFVSPLCRAESPPGPASAPALENEASFQPANLDECLETALQNNRRRPASRFAVEMAEAQHRQALAAYWPQVVLTGGYQRVDESPNFLFPANAIALPGGATLPVTIPGVGTVPLNTLEVPPQDVKLMDEDTLHASAEARWLLYDGGMRRGLREQTGARVEMMRQESRRTDLEIADSVKRLYFGAVLAARIHQVGKDTLARMEATLRLTETLYKEGGGTVKKTDWLANKVVVESIRSMVATLEKNEAMARAALANTMGLPWNADVTPADDEMPFDPFRDRLDGLVSAAYRFNPDWAKIEAGLRAAEGAVRSAMSGHFPKVALVGELHKWWNEYDAGIATDRNEEGWSVGVGIEIPIFSGFLTRNRVAEARAHTSKIEAERFLLQEGIGLQIRDVFLSLSAAEKSHQATKDAMDAAEENRDLNTRAYQHGLVETEDVIQAQLMESLMSARHFKVRYDHIALRSRLDLVVGTEVLKRLDP